MHPGARALFEDPDLFLFRLDAPRGRALFVFMSRDSYRSSAFLDLRGRRRRVGGLQVGLRDLVAAAPLHLRARPSRFIFHIGHTCSTLLSRSIGELPGTHVLREPPVLIDLARSSVAGSAQRGFTVAGWRAACDQVLAILAKTYHRTEVAVIKPSSLANGIMRHALRSTRRRAVFVYCSLPSFLASMLKSEDNQKDGAADLAFRLRTSPGRLRPALVRGQPIARKLAALWVLHMDLFLNLLPRVPSSRLRSLDADDFIAAPADTLRQLGRLFGLEWSSADIASVVSSPIFLRDAKRPERRYDAQARHAELAAARHTFGAEIADASAWAARLTRARPIPEVLPRALLEHRAA